MMELESRFDNSVSFRGDYLRNCCRPTFKPKWLKNKGAVLVLIWSFLCFTVYHYFTIREISRDSVKERLPLSSGATISMGLILPLGGWLADAFDNYRVIHYGMWIMWFGAMLNGFSLVIGKVIEDYGAHIDPWVSLFAKVIMGLGLGVFQANIIQFGIDQLIDASSVEITHCVVYYCHFHFWHNHVFQQLVCTRICSNSSHSSVSVTGHWLRFSCRSLADKGTNRQKPIASDTESCSLHN